MSNTAGNAIPISALLEDEKMLTEVSTKITKQLTHSVPKEQMALFSLIVFNLINYGAPWEIFSSSRLKEIKNEDPGLFKIMMDFQNIPEDQWNAVLEQGCVIAFNDSDLVSTLSHIHGMPIVSVQEYVFGSDYKVHRGQSYDVPLFSREYYQIVITKKDAYTSKLTYDFAMAMQNAHAGKPTPFDPGAVIALYSLNDTDKVQIPKEWGGGTVTGYCVDTNTFNTVSATIFGQPRPINNMVVATNSRSVFGQLG